MSFSLRTWWKKDTPLAPTAVNTDGAMATQIHQRNVSSMNNNSKSGIPVEPSEMTKDEEKKMKKTYLCVFIVLLLDLISFTVILPLLPSLMEAYGKQDATGLYGILKRMSSVFRRAVGFKKEAADTIFLGGIVSAMFSLVQYLSSPFIGAASDVYGRRRVLLICMIGMALSYFLWTISHNFFLFTIARFVGGLSKGNIGICTAAVSDVSNKQKRGRGMAMIGIAYSIGFIVGPSIGGIFMSAVTHKDGGVPHLYPGLFTLVIALINIAFIYFCFEETLPPAKRIQEKSYITENASKFVSPASIFSFAPVKDMPPESRSSVKRLGLVYFLYLFIYSGIEFTLPFLVAYRYSYGNRQQGMMFLVIGILMALIQGGYTRRVKAGSEKKIITRGMYCLIPTYLVVGYIPFQVVNVFVLPLFAFASATVVPCMTTMVSMYGREDQKGAIMGIFRSIGSLARATGPLLFSTVFWLLGDNYSYTIGAVSILIPIFLFRATLKEKE